MAFDVDWSLIPKESRAMLAEWVANEGGGLILVAGDVFTPELAADEEQFAEILKLYPVVLEAVRPQFDRKDRWNQPWKLGFTPEGLAAEFLQIADDAGGLAAGVGRVPRHLPGVSDQRPQGGSERLRVLHRSVVADGCRSADRAGLAALRAGGGRLPRQSRNVATAVRSTRTTTTGSGSSSSGWRRRDVPNGACNGPC